MIDLPFTSHWHTLHDGHRLHYFDEGAGRPVLMLHGNPTWSFMYRKLVHALAPQARAVAIDHLGCGLSDKPQKHLYCLQNHVDNTADFIQSVLADTPIDLIAHDWGGPIAVAYAEQHPERIHSLILMNTVAWPSRQFPKAIYLTKSPFVGAFLVRNMNVLLHIALRNVPLKPLPRDIEAGFRLPYQTYHDRIAIQRFPQDIPLSPSHPSYAAFQQLEQRLPAIAAIPLCLCWGEVDFCFPMTFLDKWRLLFPHASIHTYPHASHLLLEDAPDDVIRDIKAFLCQVPPDPPTGLSSPQQR